MFLGEKGFRGLSSQFYSFLSDSRGEFFDHSGDWNEEVRADNTMWLIVYEACNVMSNGCKELGANKSSSDKGRGMDGVGDTYDAQAERS